MPLISVGTGLQALRREREAEMTRLARRAPGRKPPPAQENAKETLLVDVSGTLTPIFVLGADNPDESPGKDYYIP